MNLFAYASTRTAALGLSAKIDLIIALRPDPLRLEVGTTFALILNVCTKGGEPAELVGIDAQLDEKNVIGEVPNIVSSGR